MDLLKNVTGPPLIRALMEAHRITNVDVAIEEDVTPMYVSYVIHGKRTGYRIRRAIARKCGVQVETLWPDTPSEQRLAA
jgi:hypothetical protein